MKTIQQRLQSRISKRRNFIRFVEEDVTMLKSSRYQLQLVSTMFGLEPNDNPALPELNEGIREAKKVLKGLADDQRLDKRIKQIISGENAHRRFFDMPELV